MSAEDKKTVLEAVKEALDMWTQTHMCTLRSPPPSPLPFYNVCAQQVCEDNKTELEAVKGAPLLVAVSCSNVAHTCVLLAHAPLPPPLAQVSAEDKKTVLEAVKEALEWVEENTEADADEFNDKRKEVGGSGVGICAQGRIYLGGAVVFLPFGDSCVVCASLLCPRGGCWIAGCLHEICRSIGGGRRR